MITLSVPVLIGAVISFYIVRYLSAFYTNYRLAKSIGVPVLIAPVFHHAPIWLLSQDLLRPILEKLPNSLGGWVRYSRRAWNFHDKARLHEEVGKVFVVCTPAHNTLHIADATLSDYVLSKRKMFLKPTAILGDFVVFGESVASVDESDWQRHRRITAPPFNERNSALVWQESSRQAVQMLEAWVEAQDKIRSVRTVEDDTATLALHVLTMAGFGIEYQFRTELDKVGEGHTMTYHDALYAVMRNIFLAIVTPRWVYKMPFLPKILADYSVSVNEFQKYLSTMVTDAKKRLKNGEEMPANLLSVLVQKSEEVNNAENGKALGAKKNGLEDDEIYGNLFIFSFAGHETTAKTLSYTIYLLAAYPEWQTWLHSELDVVFAGHTDSSTLDYESCYPRLKRCLAIMYETLRLYSPVLFVPKWTGSSQQTAEYEGKDLVIPPRTMVSPNIVALQTLPEYWVDPLEWKPTRFMVSPGQAIPKPPATSDEAALEMEKVDFVQVPGSYAAWSDGPRICPGKKFSQVEFVSVIATLLWKHRIVIEPKAGESVEDARARVLDVVEDSQLQFTLQMKDSMSVGLRFIER